MVGDDETVLALVRLAGCRHAVETLDLLAEGPLAFATVRRRLHARRRDLRAAMRTLAAHRAVCRAGRYGSWDTPDRGPAHFTLTREGIRLNEQLNRLDVWVAMYEIAAGA
ncbi:MAG TPA: hypothetical protein VFG87_12530 [Amycolatopsis sp.]|nr:hypothetical protein [Amycolatopsis sp.]